MKFFLQQFLRLITDSKIGRFFTPLCDVLLFVVLLLSFHYIYLYWSGSMNFAPVRGAVDKLFVFSSDVLFNHSKWTLRNLGIKFITENQTFWVYNGDKISGFVDVEPGCTSLKQWMHWLFLMLLFPGPWRHKVWYIPIGLIVIHFINVFRIVGLTISVKYYPQYFDTFHNYFFKTLFYFMIFMMWLFWVEKFKNRTKKLEP